MDQVEASSVLKQIDAGDLFKELVWKAIVKAATSALISAIPWLGAGPMGIITGMLVGIFGDFIYAQLKGVYDFEAIGFKNEAHRREFEDASLKLKLVAKTHGVGSVEFIAAREVHRAELAKFVKFGG